jgi:hypothetical protein
MPVEPMVTCHECGDQVDSRETEPTSLGHWYCEKCLKGSLASLARSYRKVPEGWSADWKLPPTLEEIETAFREGEHTLREAIEERERNRPPFDPRSFRKPVG